MFLCVLLTKYVFGLWPLVFSFVFWHLFRSPKKWIFGLAACHPNKITTFVLIYFKNVSKMMPVVLSFRLLAFVTLSAITSVKTYC